MGFFFYDSLMVEKEKGILYMVKIIYLDIDGTLRDEHKGIPNSAILALKQCQEHEIQIIICTGRNLGSIQNDVMALQTDGIISGGGCYIWYRGEEVFRKHFSISVLKKVLSAAARWELSLAMEAEQKIYMDHNASIFYKKDFQHKICNRNKTEQKILYRKNKISYKENFGDIKSDKPKIHKICIFGQQEAVEQLEKELKQVAEIIQKKKWDDYWYLELLPKGCNKGSAVKKLNRKLGISKKESMSFGDSENDIAMMEATGIAIAVGYNSPIIEKYASSICEPFMKDGIYKELLRRNIIKKIDKERKIKNEEILVAKRSCLSDISQKLL